MGYGGAKNPDSRDPTYTDVQDYAETIRVTFDTTKLSYDDLLRMFWGFHTPYFAGSQYRSAVFVHTAEQRAVAVKSLDGQPATLRKCVSVEDAGDFYRAEEYHQKYLDKCMMR